MLSESPTQCVWVGTRRRWARVDTTRCQTLLLLLACPAEAICPLQPPVFSLSSPTLPVDKCFPNETNNHLDEAFAHTTNGCIRQT